MPHDDQAEMFYWVDDQDEILGSITRKEAHSGTKKFHRAVDILIFNQNEELLMQKRSMHKDVSPVLWTISTSGHVTYPMSYEESAIKEIEEEVGLSITKADLKELGRLTILYEKEAEKSVLYRVDVVLEKEVIFDPIEIDQVEWVHPRDLQTWVEDHPITIAARHVLQHTKYIK